MRFFPALTEDFTSPLPLAALLRQMQASVQQARKFSGSVAGNRFTISRVIDYRNSMLPRISGEVVAGPLGSSRLRLRHQLHLLVLAFGAMWLGIVGSVVGGMGLVLAQGSFRAVGAGLAKPDSGEDVGVRAVAVHGAVLGRSAAVVAPAHQPPTAGAGGERRKQPALTQVERCR